MTLYAYTARDASGRAVRGTMEAHDRSAALAALRTRTLHVTGIERWPSAAHLALFLDQIGPLSRRKSVAFFRALAALVKAGVTLRRSIEIAIEQCDDSRLGEALRSVLSDIENGLPLSEGMMRRPKEFPRVFVAMIRAGELGGALDDVLERLAGLLERDRTVRKRLASALTYPAVVAAAAIVLVWFLLTSIVPMFSSMYAQMHVPLPASTALLVAAGSVLRSPAALVCSALFFALFAACAAYLRSARGGSAFLETLLFRLPAIGTIARKTIVGRFARTLGTLLRSGVNVIAALDVLGDAVGSGTYKSCLHAVARDLAAGSTLSGPLAASHCFEPLFVQLVRVGEETGDLDAMLLRIADYYDVDVETALETLTALLEPAMVLILGSVIGFIVSAIFIPLYGFIGNLK